MEVVGVVAAYLPVVRVCTALSREALPVIDARYKHEVYRTVRFLCKCFVFGGITVDTTRREPSGDFAKTFVRGCKEGTRILDLCLTHAMIRRLTTRPSTPMVQQPLVGLGLLTVNAVRSHSDTPHSVGLLWTSDRSDAEIYT